MKIIAKAHILYNSVTYKPGDELPNNNPEMVKAWKEAGTVEVIEDKKESSNTDPSAMKNPSPDGKSPETGNDTQGNGDPEGSNSDADTPKFYTKEQLDKLPSKAAIAEYAESIGLSDLNTKPHKSELINEVLAYIEEVKKSNDV